jgi:hypothetical protein
MRRGLCSTWRDTSSSQISSAQLSSYARPSPLRRHNERWLAASARTVAIDPELSLFVVTLMAGCTERHAGRAYRGAHRAELQVLPFRGRAFHWCPICLGVRSRGGLRWAGPTVLGQRIPRRGRLAFSAGGAARYHGRRCERGCEQAGCDFQRTAGPRLPSGHPPGCGRTHAHLAWACMAAHTAAAMEIRIFATTRRPSRCRMAWLRWPLS